MKKTPNLAKLHRAVVAKSNHHLRFLNHAYVERGVMRSSNLDILLSTTADTPDGEYTPGSQPILHETNPANLQSFTQTLSAFPSSFSPICSLKHSDIAYLVEATIDAISQDATRLALNNILLEVAPDRSVIATATDGRRLHTTATTALSVDPTQKTNCIVPADAASIIRACAVSSPGGTVEVLTAQDSKAKYIQFKSESWTCVFREPDTVYPDFCGIRRDTVHLATFSRQSALDNLAPLITLARLLARKSHPTADIVVDPGSPYISIRLLGAAVEAQDMLAHIPAKQVAGFRGWFNFFYLHDIIRSSGEEISLAAEPFAPAILRSGGFAGICMPIRDHF